MLICPNCGKEVSENTNFCPECGYRIIKENPYQSVQPKENTGTLYAVLSFFFPLVGLILFIIWHKTRPMFAKKAGIAALVSVALSLFSIVTMVLLLI